METRKVIWDTVQAAWYTYSQDLVEKGGMQLRGLVRLEGFFWYCCGVAPDRVNTPIMQNVAVSGGGDYTVAGLPGETLWLGDYQERWHTDLGWFMTNKDSKYHDPNLWEEEAHHYVKPSIRLPWTAYQTVRSCVSADKICQNRLRDVYYWQQRPYAITGAGPGACSAMPLLSAEEVVLTPGMVAHVVPLGKFCYVGRVVKCKRREWVMGLPRVEFVLDSDMAEFEQKGLFE